MHGVAHAVAMLNRRNPDRQVDAASVRRRARNSERSVALDSASLAVADGPTNRRRTTIRGLLLSNCVALE